MTRPTCTECGKKLSDYNEPHDLGDCCKYLKAINKQFLRACKIAYARIEEYYEQESFDEAPLFKATKALLAAISAAKGE